MPGSGAVTIGRNCDYLARLDHMVTTPLMFIFVRFCFMESLFRILYTLQRPEVTTSLAEILRDFRPEVLLCVHLGAQASHTRRKLASHDAPQVPQFLKSTCPMRTPTSLPSNFLSSCVPSLNSSFLGLCYPRYWLSLERQGKAGEVRMVPTLITKSISRPHVRLPK